MRAPSLPAVASVVQRLLEHLDLPDSSWRAELSRESRIAGLSMPSEAIGAEGQRVDITNVCSAEVAEFR